MHLYRYSITKSINVEILCQMLFMVNLIVKDSKLKYSRISFNCFYGCKNYIFSLLDWYPS